MSNPRFSGKIINHSHGQGATSIDDVQQRAAELAQIDGRDGGEFTSADLENARRELMGGHLEEANEDEGYFLASRDGVVSSLGHHVPNQNSDESENAVTELIMEGMEEAEHEQMLEASAQQNDFDE